MEDKEKSNIERFFTNALNRHGYSFQYAVLKAAHEAMQQRKSQWRFICAEFPVDFAQGTHIDFILQAESNAAIYLIAECKRAHPAFTNWCFYRVPYVRRNRSIEHFFTERLFRDSEDKVFSGVHRLFPVPDSGPAYHGVHEVKSGTEGDPCASPKPVTDAVAQLFRGVSGLANLFHAKSYLLTVNAATLLIPVIFTTANLFVSDVELSEADLLTGNVQNAKIKPAPEGWVYFQHPISPSLKHNVPQESKSEDLPKLLDAEYTRSTAIVNAAHLAEFLTKFGPQQW